MGVERRHVSGDICTVLDTNSNIQRSEFVDLG